MSHLHLSLGFLCAFTAALGGALQAGRADEDLGLCHSIQPHALPESRP
jgi:hypothetical protein